MAWLRTEGPSANPCQIIPSLTYNCSRVSSPRKKCCHRETRLKKESILLQSTLRTPVHYAALEGDSAATRRPLRISPIVVTRLTWSLSLFLGNPGAAPDCSTSICRCIARPRPPATDSPCLVFPKGPSSLHHHPSYPGARAHPRRFPQLPTYLQLTPFSPSQNSLSGERQ